MAASASGMDLSDRVALVTGASRGLGAHFARTLASAGARVVLVTRQRADGEREAAAIRADGGQAIGIAADVRDESSLVAAFDSAEATFGLVTTVVASAGVNVAGAALDVSAKDLADLFATNVTGAFLTAREGARRLTAVDAADRPEGRIILVSSMTARRVVRGLAPYSASKAALEQMGRVLAKDWARERITVNMLAPGNIATEITLNWFETNAGRRQLASFPRRRLMPADALDVPLLHLCSSGSGAITGSVFSLDDGQAL